MDRCKGDRKAATWVGIHSRLRLSLGDMGIGGIGGVVYLIAALLATNADYGSRTLQGPAKIFPKELFWYR